MGHDFVEAFVKLKAGAKTDQVRHWFEQRGLTVLHMQAGLLLSGAADVINRVFNCDVSTLPRPARLQPPAAVADDVESIEIPRPRYPMSGHQAP
jgi:hypothetical protein